MTSVSTAENADHRIRHMRSRRSKLVAPLVVLVLTIGAIAAVWGLVGGAGSSHAAELRVGAMALSLADLQNAPFDADPAEGGAAVSPRISKARIERDEHAISSGLTVDAQAGVPVSMLQSARADLARVDSLVTTVYGLAVQKGGLVASGAPVVLPLGRQMIVRGAALTGVLNAIGRVDATRAASARTQTKLGAAIAMLLLLSAFAYFYWRSVAAHESVERLAGEKEALLGVSRSEARTDALTGLRNRRALTTDLANAIVQASDSEELLLVMFDLDGFKQYNDTFGHPAGDAMLQRLGGRLAVATAKHSGSAYRMGGDEFCVLVQ